MKNNQLSYNDYTSWKDFQSYFPEDLQICADYFPIENYFEYEGNTIHIDHYIPKVNEKKVKLIMILLKLRDVFLMNLLQNLVTLT